MFFYCREDNISSCEAHKQFGAEPAQYGLEINFNTFGRNIYTLNLFCRLSFSKIKINREKNHPAQVVGRADGVRWNIDWEITESGSEVV